MSSDVNLMGEKMKKMKMKKKKRRAQQSLETPVKIVVAGFKLIFKLLFKRFPQAEPLVMVTSSTSEQTDLKVILALLLPWRH